MREKPEMKIFKKFNEIGHLQTLFDFQDGNVLRLGNFVKQWQWKQLWNKEIYTGNDKTKEIYASKRITEISWITYKKKNMTKTHN